MRDYLAWHDQYDDPDSGLSWRLRRVQFYIRNLLDATPGPVRVLSACAGDARDILGVLAERDDAHRVEVTVVELLPELAHRARASADAAGLRGIDVRIADAGDTDAYAGAVPADLVLLVGIFGNISDADIERTIRNAPQLCAPGATLIWSRAPHGDHNEAVRQWFAGSGFNELDYGEGLESDRTGLGRVRYVGDPVPFVAGQRWFTFVR